MTCRLLLLASVALAVWFTSGRAQAATSCSASIENIAFNVVDPEGNTTSRTTIRYDCGSLALAWVNVSMCFALQPAPGGVRAMRNDYDDGLALQLYKDANRTTPWGNNGANRIQVSLRYPSLFVGGDGATVDVYGTVPSQPGAAAGVFNSQEMVQLTYRVAEGDAKTPIPSTCNGSGDSSFVLPATASVPDSCKVLTASNLNFNPGAPLAGTRTGELNSTSAINLSCRRRTEWQLDLDQGLYAEGGVRHMKNQNGDALISYRLSQDPGGDLPWGNGADGRTADPAKDSSSGSHTLIVYGEVPDQPLEQAGRYSDTIKVTVTY